jgi:hypothetical protein
MKKTETVEEYLARGGKIKIVTGEEIVAPAPSWTCPDCGSHEFEDIDVLGEDEEAETIRVSRMCLDCGSTDYVSIPFYIYDDFDDDEELNSCDICGLRDSAIFDEINCCHTCDECGGRE